MENQPRSQVVPDECACWDHTNDSESTISERKSNDLSDHVPQIRPPTFSVSSTSTISQHLRQTYIAKLVSIDPAEAVLKGDYERVMASARGDVATVGDYLTDVLNHIGPAFDCSVSEQPCESSVRVGRKNKFWWILYLIRRVLS